MSLCIDVKQHVNLLHRSAERGDLADRVRAIRRVDDESDGRAAGDKDPNVTPDVVRMVAEGIGGPVRVEIFPDGVHQLMLFETEAFSTLVHDFCTGVISNG